MALEIAGQARLRHFKKDTFPQMGSLQLDCGKCGNRQFDVFVEPREDDARIVGIVCTECRDVFRVDLGGFLDAKGKVRRVGLDEITEV